MKIELNSKTIDKLYGFKKKIVRFIVNMMKIFVTPADQKKVIAKMAEKS